MGLGFFLAGLILLAWPSPGPDRQEIIDLARSYGMVFREEVVPFDLKSEPPAPTGGTTPEILVTIPAGATLEEIAILLERKGIVSAALFEAEARKAGAVGKLKAGSHYLPQGDLAQVLKRLTE